MAKKLWLPTRNRMIVRNPPDFATAFPGDALLEHAHAEIGVIAARCDIPAAWRSLASAGDRVRLASRGGYDYTKRFPTAHKRPHKRLVIDGEAVLLAFHGISDLDGLRSGKQDEAVQLYEFDFLALDGDDRARCRCRCASSLGSSQNDREISLWVEIASLISLQWPT